MALITVHLFNSIDMQQELIVNSDHIVSVEAANVGANIQMTSGPTIHTVEGLTELAQLISGSGSLAVPQLEIKSAEAEAPVVETAAERKARLKAEAEATAQQ